MSNIETVKKVRREFGLTQKGLAYYLGVTERQVRRWEAGDTPVPKVVILALQALRPGQSPSG